LSDNRFLGTLLDTLSLLVFAQLHSPEGHTRQQIHSQRQLLIRAAMSQSLPLLECVGNIVQDAVFGDEPANSKFENSRPTEKIRKFILRKFGKELDTSHEAYRHANSLCVFRNALFHPKNVVHEFRATIRDVESGAMVGPMSEAEYTDKNHLKDTDVRFPTEVLPASPLEWKREHVAFTIDVVAKFLQYAFAEVAGMDGTEAYILVANTGLDTHAGVKRAVFDDQYEPIFVMANEIGVSFEFMNPNAE